MTLKLYFIFEGDGIQDGEMYSSKADLFKALNYATDGDIRVCEFDPAELLRDHGTTLHDVSEAIAQEAWDAGVEMDCVLFAQFFPTEVQERPYVPERRRVA